LNLTHVECGRQASAKVYSYSELLYPYGWTTEEVRPGATSNKRESGKTPLFINVEAKEDQTTIAVHGPPDCLDWDNAKIVDRNAESRLDLLQKFYSIYVYPYSDVTFHSKINYGGDYIRV